MVVDSSAITAIVFREPEGNRMAAAILAATERLMSVVNWLEITMVVESRFGLQAANEMHQMLLELEIRSLPMDAKQLSEAIHAWRKYGKGRHPASLNMGDCCAYAAAIARADGLLFKGNNFPHTDVICVEW